jgi:hypothetical protein
VHSYAIVKAEIIWGKSIYYIERWNSNEDKYYLLKIVRYNRAFEQFKQKWLKENLYIISETAQKIRLINNLLSIDFIIRNQKIDLWGLLSYPK